MNQYSIYLLTQSVLALYFMYQKFILNLPWQLHAKVV